MGNLPLYGIFLRIEDVSGIRYLQIRLQRVEGVNASYMNILAIGSHPDDIELGCGGALIRAAKNGHKVFLYVLTAGNKSGDAFQRTREVIESAKFIGAEAAWIDNFEDTNLKVGSKLVNHIEYFIGKTDPDIIYTHAANDYHHDHRAVAECTLEAARNNQNVLAYEIPVTKDFSPHIYYDISEVVDDKVRLLELFLSQRGKVFTGINAVKGMAEYRALQNRLNSTITHVECFQVLKMCVDIDFKPMKLAQKGIPAAVVQDMADDLTKIVEYRKKGEMLQTQGGASIEHSSVFDRLADAIENKALLKPNEIVSSHSAYGSLTAAASKQRPSG
jgi:LmbE family N-acetylglucosaminyl deacetylase